MLILLAVALTNRERRRFDVSGTPYGPYIEAELDVAATRREALQIAGEALSALDAYDLDVDWDNWSVTANSPARFKWAGREMHATVRLQSEQHSQIKIICRPRICFSSKPSLDSGARSLVSAYFDQCRRIAATSIVHERD